MTRRRIIDPGTTWALSRRTTRRHFLLNPDQARQLEGCYWYCLGLAAQRFGVVVHAGCLMSTHSHEVVTDVRGVLPRFLQEFHRLLALTTKALRGWPGEVFDKRSTGQHALLTPEATIEALAYLIANPVEAGAVRYAKDWPGAHTLPATSVRGSSRSSGRCTTSTPRTPIGPTSSNSSYRCPPSSSSTTAPSLPSVALLSVFADESTVRGKSRSAPALPSPEHGAYFDRCIPDGPGATSCLGASIHSLRRRDIGEQRERPCSGCGLSMRSTTGRWQRGQRANAVSASLSAPGGCVSVMGLGAGLGRSAPSR